MLLRAMNRVGNCITTNKFVNPNSDIEKSILQEFWDIQTCPNMQTLKAQAGVNPATGAAQALWFPFEIECRALRGLLEGRRINIKQIYYLLKTDNILETKYYHDNDSPTFFNNSVAQCLGCTAKIASGIVNACSRIYSELEQVVENNANGGLQNRGETESKFFNLIEISFFLMNNDSLDRPTLDILFEKIKGIFNIHRKCWYLADKQIQEEELQQEETEVLSFESYMELLGNPNCSEIDNRMRYQELMDKYKEYIPTRSEFAYEINLDFNERFCELYTNILQNPNISNNILIYIYEHCLKIWNALVPERLIFESLGTGQDGVTSNSESFCKSLKEEIMLCLSLIMKHPQATDELKKIISEKFGKLEPAEVCEEFLGSENVSSAFLL